MKTSDAVDNSAAELWVVGSDGSSEAEAALRWGLAQAAHRDATVLVVRAWHLPAVAGAEFGVAPSDDVEPHEAHPGLDDIVASVMQGGQRGQRDQRDQRDQREDGNRGSVSVESDVVYGTASRVLLEESEGADLLIVGSRGLGGFRRLLLGSVSQQCATHAPHPVVVVRPPADGAEFEPLVERLVVGVDGSPASLAALRWAHDFATGMLPVVAIGAWAISVLGIEEMQSELELLYEDAQRNFDQSVNEMEAELGAVGFFERQFTRGAPGRTLVEACGPADLLVVGERGHRGLSGVLLGSVVTEVLHRARCAVAVIPVPSTD